MIHQNESKKTLPLLIMGTGANAREVRSIVKAIDKENSIPEFNFLGFVCEAGQSSNPDHLGLNIACYDDGLVEFAKQFDVLGVVIPVSTPQVKKKIYDHIKNIPNIIFPNIIHPRANILDSETLELGRGCIITAGVFVSIDVRLGDFVYLNYNCTIGHDTTIGDFCSVNPLASVSGAVIINDMCLIGASSSIKQGLTIGKKAVIGLGAFVVQSVPENTVMVCEPAHPMVKS